METFLLCGVLVSVSGQFFHESSGVTLKSSGGPSTSDFGFSIAYQEHTGSTARLLIGAPRQDNVGKVYSCPLSDLSSINCSIDVTSLQIENKIPAAQKLEYPDANIFLGSSIAATSDYFFTCAPLLIKSVVLCTSIRNRTVKFYDDYDYVEEELEFYCVNENFTETFGGCYVNDYANTTEWIDISARLEDKHRSIADSLSSDAVDSIVNNDTISFNTTVHIRGGGLGWSTFADDSFLIAAKSGFQTDILYTNVNEPLNLPAKSLLDYAFKAGHGDSFTTFLNMGYGLAAGNFFSESEKLYAVSVKKNVMNGTILFLQKKNCGFKCYYLDMMKDENASNPTTIETDALSSMFGYAMAAADVNRDGLSELLVGAPAQTEDGRQELGALHVFVGGDLLSRNDKKRMRTVLADKVNGRFGSAIATSDIDGDSIPEIFVSAPYEGSGVVYVLSGYELKQEFFKEDGFKTARLSQLKLTQELRGDDGGFKLFGFSLQVVKDVDQNGCDELAIGAPESSSVKLVRCLAAVNTSLTLELVGDLIVADEEATSFKIQVCLKVTINEKCQTVSGNISVESFTTGHTKILEPKFTHNISMDKGIPHCKPITVNLTTNTIDAEKSFTFTTKLNMIDDPNPSAHNSRAVFSAYSEIEKSLTVRRYCVDTSCEPVLSYKTFWSGNDSIDFSKSEAINETVTFELKNANNDAHRVILELVIKGALVRSGECDINKNIVNENNDEKAYYTCALIKILKKGDSYNLTIPIYLPAPTNRKSLIISTKLYDAVFPNKTLKEHTKVIPFKFNASDVTVNGSSNSTNVTDKDLQDGIIFAESSAIHQEFIISNTGPVTWSGIHAVLQIKNEYIQNVTVLTRSENEKWVQQYGNDSSKFIFHNRMSIKPKSKKIIEVSMMLNKVKLEDDVTKGNLSIVSELTFDLDPLPDEREATSSTQIIYSQILSVANEKWKIILIAVILAVLLLLILKLVLYKSGFFKRAEKKKLDVLRDSIRKRSLRLASESSRGVRPSVADGVHCEIEVVDDSAFHDVDLAPTSTSSDLSLVENSKENTSK